MSRRPARFTQSDVYRVIKAVQQAGGDMIVEITTDGTIRIRPAHRSSGELETEQLSERKRIVL